MEGFEPSSSSSSSSSLLNKVAATAETQTQNMACPPRPLQPTMLLGSPSFPNAIAWSHDNLLAVASGHLVTILVLNPILIYYFFLLVVLVPSLTHTHIN